MQLDHDFHLVTNRIADLAERHKRLVEVAGMDEVAATRYRKGIERPDFHCRYAFREETFGKSAGITVEGQLVLVRAFLCLFSVTDITARAALVIGVASAGIVGADRRPRQPAQKLVDRLVDRFAEDIPKRHVDGGCSADLYAG